MRVDLYDRVLGSSNHQRSDPMILRAGKVRQFQKVLVVFLLLHFLDGFNPSEKYSSTWESSAIFGDKTYLSCHHLVLDTKAAQAPHLFSFPRILRRAWIVDPAE